MLLFRSDFFGHEACGVLVPQPRIEPGLPVLEGEVWTTGLPGTSMSFYISRNASISKTLCSESLQKPVTALVKSGLLQIFPPFSVHFALTDTCLFFISKYKCQFLKKPSLPLHINWVFYLFPVLIFIEFIYLSLSTCVFIYTSASPCGDIAPGVQRPLLRSAHTQPGVLKYLLNEWMGEGHCWWNILLGSIRKEKNEFVCGQNFTLLAKLSKKTNANLPRKKGRWNCTHYYQLPSKHPGHYAGLFEFCKPVGGQDQVLVSCR